MIINFDNIGGGGGGGSYTLPVATDSRLGGVKVGSGLTIDAAGVLSSEGGGGTQYTSGDGIQISGSTISVKAGEGLFFSGDTLVVSGGTGGSNDYYVGWDDLDDMDYGPRRELFAEIVEKYNAGYHIYASGTTAASNGFNVILPLVDFTPGTWSTDRYVGGWAKFGAIHASGETSGYYIATFNSSGNITPNGKYFPDRNFYTLPTADAYTKGGIMVGSGLTMSGDTMSVKIGDGLAFSGGTLVVSGGSGEQNYVIVDNLSEVTSPYAGLEAYRREYTENVVYTGYTIDASQIDEDYAAHIYFDGQSEISVYHNGEGFHWDWDNDSDGSLRTRENFYYTINGEHTIMSVFFNNPDAYVTFEEGVTTATTSTTISVLHKAVTYRYNGTAWEEYQPPKVYYLDKMSQAELVALYNEIYRYSEFTFPAGNYRFFVTNEGNDEYQGVFEVYVSRFYGANPVCFSGMMQSRYSPSILQRGYQLESDGTFSSNYSNNLDTDTLANDYQIVIDSNGNIASDSLGDFGNLAKFNRFVFTYQDQNIQNNCCAAPLKYFYRKNETIDGQDKLVEYIGVEININGTWYKGAWHFAEYEWGDWVTPDTWTTI